MLFCVLHIWNREGLEVTDDVSIVEYLKHPVYVTQGSYTNIKVNETITLPFLPWWQNQICLFFFFLLKVTTPDDLLLAERILSMDSWGIIISFSFSFYLIKFMTWKCVTASSRLWILFCICVCAGCSTTWYFDLFFSLAVLVDNNVLRFYKKVLKHLEKKNQKNHLHLSKREKSLIKSHLLIGYLQIGRLFDEITQLVEHNIFSGLCQFFFWVKN